MNELKCGIEIHQQLDTRKLFCSCDSNLMDEGEGSYYRRLRPTTSELGKIDRAALAQFQRGLGYRYQCCNGVTCLVDLDEEPPHPVNQDAMDIALTFSEMLNANVIDEIQFMRKIVVDGSNTSGFQRTSLISTDGSIEVNGKRIGILSVCLEEDAARKLESNDKEILYRLDRLGIPLIEVATAPDMTTPEEVMEVALRIGTLLRATKKVKRGIGTIREDLNISVPNGARIEIKGVQELRMLPDFVRNEMKRQNMLIEIRGILQARDARCIPFEPIDVTDMFKDCDSKVIRGALDAKGKIIAIRLPCLAGVLNGDDGRLRLGAELAQYARTRGVKGIFHSDELPNYGISQSYVDALKAHLNVEGYDAFAICAAKEPKAKEALEMAVMRANMALDGVPEETRDPLPDGTTRYSRPLPGSARMYPETDVPPHLITEERIHRVRDAMPDLPEEIERRIVERYGLNEQQARQLVRKGYDEVFFPMADRFKMVTTIATTLLGTYPELEKEGIDVDSIPFDALNDVFQGVSDSTFSKEAIPLILKEVSKGLDVDDAVKSLGLAAIGSDEATDIIASIIRDRGDFVKSKGLDAVGPLMGPVMAALRGKMDGSKVNSALRSEIERFLKG